MLSFYAIAFIVNPMMRCDFEGNEQTAEKCA